MPGTCQRTGNERNQSMTTEIDHLMDKLRNDEQLSNSDIDKIISDQIKRLALYTSGAKVKKTLEEKVDVSGQMEKILSSMIPQKPKSNFKRRI